MSIHLVCMTVPHSEQRYDTAGDWINVYSHCDEVLPHVREHAGIIVRASALGDWRMEFILAMHELVEAALCKHRGITQAEVDAFDKAHPDAEEPGALPDAPYRDEHQVATGVEIVLAEELGVDWLEYTDRLNALGKEEK